VRTEYTVNSKLAGTLNFSFTNVCICLSALTRLVVCQKDHPARQKSEWWGTGMVISLSEMQMICIWSSDATATLSSLVSLKSRLVSPFWCWLTRVFLENKPRLCNSFTIWATLKIAIDIYIDIDTDITGVFHQWQYNTCRCTQIPIQQSNLSIIAVLCTQYLPVQPRPVVIIKWHCTAEKDVCNYTNGPHVNLCGVW